MEMRGPSPAIGPTGDITSCWLFLARSLGGHNGTGGTKGENGWRIDEYKKGTIVSPALMEKSLDQKRPGSVISQIIVPWTILGTILLTIFTLI